jgi:hypothetical protein
MVGALEVRHPSVISPQEASPIPSEVGAGSLARVGQLVEADSVVIDLKIAGDIHAVRARHTEAATDAGDFPPRCSRTLALRLLLPLAQSAASTEPHRSSHQAGAAHHQAPQGLAS